MGKVFAWALFFLFSVGAVSAPDLSGQLGSAAIAVTILYWFII